MPQEMQTPTSTIVKAIDGFLADSSITGQAAECSGSEVHYRPAYTHVNDAAKYLLEGSYVGKIDRVDVLQHAKLRSDYYDTMEAKVATLSLNGN